MIEHSITVGRLRDLLAELKDDDVLVPNDVRNLAILRDRQQIGFLDLLKGHEAVEFYVETP